MGARHRSSPMNRYPSIFYYTSIANFFFFLGNSMFILLPVYLKHLGAAEAYIGFMGNMDKIFMVVAAVVLGSFLRQHDRIKLLRWGYGFLLITYCLYLPLSSLSWYLPLIRIAHGVGFSIAMIVGSTIIFENVLPERATEAIGVYGITGSISNAISPAIGEFLLHEGYPFQMLFLFSVCCLAVSLVIALRMPCTKSRASDAPCPSSGSLRLMHNRDFIRYGLVSLIFGGGFGVLVTFLPNFIRTCTSLNYSLFFIVYIAVLIVIRLMFLNMITRWNKVLLLKGVLMIGACMNILITALDSLLLLLIISIMYGITHGVLYPVLNALVVNAAPQQQRGRANALFSALFNGGMLVFACCAGFLVDVFHTYSAAFVLCAVAFCAGCLFVAAPQHSPAPTTS
ncbi:MAG: MFS transporter [Desulfobacterota bacterium]|nr:MFS transporter [Thermodesulfobacteriota bacterium]